MIDIIHRIGINASSSRVYAAVATAEGVAGWWTRATSGSATPGGTLQFRFHATNGEEIGRMQFEVLALVPERHVRWRCTSGPAEWIGTEVTFDLKQERDHVVVLFGHRHWREAVEFTAHCSMKWATFLLSLRQFVETGEGRPAPDDLKIDELN
jgi:uncharacterized protein YndB with AHSA1/START domain